MKIFIRAYGSHLMGMGHLYRIKKIVRKLKNKGSCNITLFTQSHHEAKSIFKSIDVDNLIEIQPEISKSNELLELKKNLSSGYDICINDQLNTDEEIAEVLDFNCKKSVTFDDLGSGNYLFDYMFNVLYPTNLKLKNEYNDYSYMLLNDHSDIKAKVTFKDKVSTIFINQGAADTWGAIPDIITDLNSISTPFKIKALLGPSFRHFKELRQALKKNVKEIEIINQTNNVTELVKDCDLAILGAGNTLFEVASLGIPIIASTREPKELITISRLLKDNIVYGFPFLYDKGLSETIENVINNKSQRFLKFNSNRKLFNYDGLDRVINLIGEINE